MKRKLLCSLVLVLAAAARVHADGVDDFVKAVMQQRHIPAISIAVVKDGVVVKTAGYGLANMEHDIPARPDTVYKIGSASKQFIAAGTMLLVQDGRLSVDDKLSKYLEGAPAAWQSITIRQLLTHTSGLAREGPAFDPYKVQPDIEVIKSAYSLPLLFKPGEKHEYSNLGYFLLAEIIRTVSGKPWDQFLNERIFAPLGMTSTRPVFLPSFQTARPAMSGIWILSRTRKTGLLRAQVAPSCLPFKTWQGGKRLCKPIGF